MMNIVYKTALILLVVGMSTMTFGQEKYLFYPKISIDAPGKHFSEMSLEGVHKNTNTGITAALEVITKPVFYNMSFGGGISYQFARKLDVENYQGFQFATVYGIVKYRALQFAGIECSVLGNLGYNGIFGGIGNYSTYSVDGVDMAYTLLGGLYYAGGVRFDKDIYFFEAVYKQYGGTASSTTFNYKAAIHYPTVSFSIGVLI